MDQFKVKFKEEAADLLIALEKALLALEQDSSNSELTEEVFRVMHTLKGNSAMFDLGNIESLTHHLESIYDNIREGKQSLSSEILDISLSSVDHLRYLLDHDPLTDAADISRQKTLLDQIIALGKNSPEESVTAEPAEDAGEPATVKTYFISFRPDQTLLRNGSNPLYLIEELHAIGNCLAFPRLNKLPLLADIDATACYTSWDILLSTTADTTDIFDVFLFVEDEALIEVNLLSDDDVFKFKTLIRLLRRSKKRDSH